MCSSFGSALHARAASIRHAKLPSVRQSASKKGTANTPGSVVSASSAGFSAGEEKNAEVTERAEGDAKATVPVPEGAEGARTKNVAWEDRGKEGEDGDMVSVFLRAAARCAVCDEQLPNTS